jgi:hypothetical protein
LYTMGFPPQKSSKYIASGTALPLGENRVKAQTQEVSETFLDGAGERSNVPLARIRSNAGQCRTITSTVYGSTVSNVAARFLEVLHLFPLTFLYLENPHFS